MLSSDSSSFHRQALDQISDAVFFSELPSLRIVDCNRSAATLLGRCRSALLERSLPDLLADRDHREQLQACLPQLPISLQLGLCSETGPLLVDFQLSALSPDPHPPLVLAVARPRRADSHMWPAASESVDDLTGLPGRKALIRRLAALGKAGRLDGDYHALFFIDVDRFKGINDRLGHLAGDLVLRSVARKLQRCVRPSDLVVRYGGDEFVALVEGLGEAEEAEQIASRLGHALRVPLRAFGRRIWVTCSVGGVVTQRTDALAEDLLRRADVAMYRAKSMGPGCFVAETAS